MNNIRLFRRRYLPDEITELKDDKILYMSDKIIITKWNVLKPRKDIDHGVSAYFLDLGIKVSKVYDPADALVYWYCDIVDIDYNKDTSSYVFTDLLIDVLVYPDNFVKVVDLDEFAQTAKEDIIDKDAIIRALMRTNSLLNTIYSGNFADYTKYINEFETK